MTRLELNPGATALLVMDCQVNILSSLAASEKSKVLTNVARATGAARKGGVAVIYVVVQFREGYPEVSGRNPLFSAIRQAGRLRETDPDSRIADEVRPQPGEVVVAKKRISAFAGSDLEIILRAKGIDSLVLAGVSSLGVVESTARAAFDMDFRLFVLGDCCSDRDPEAHHIAMTRVLPRISTVCSTDELIGSIVK